MQFFLRNIWSPQKKAVPLHRISAELRFGEQEMRNPASLAQLARARDL